jgi:hypothetical protein
MKSFSSLLLPGVLAAFAATFVELRPTQAGEVVSSFGCIVGECWGTMREFRESPSPGDYAEFLSMNEGRGFFAQFGTRYFQCTIAPNTVVSRMADLALNHTGYFRVWRDDTGYCTRIELRNSSRHPEI